MVNLPPVALAFILLGCAVIALAIGYFLGGRFAGKRSVAVRAAQEKHDGYKNDVREHFEQTSAIMARMVDDYRDMYQHIAQGAQELADIHPEKQVTPPPAPEAITQDQAATKPADNSAAPKAAGLDNPRQTEAAAPNRDAVMNSDSSNDRPWNKGQDAQPAGLK